MFGNIRWELHLDGSMIEGSLDAESWRNAKNVLSSTKNRIKKFVVKDDVSGSIKISFNECDGYFLGKKAVSNFSETKEFIGVGFLDKEKGKVQVLWYTINPDCDCWTLSDVEFRTIEEAGFFFINNN